MHFSNQNSWRRQQRFHGTSRAARLAGRFRTTAAWLLELLDRGESRCIPQRRVAILAAVILCMACAVVYRLYDLQEMEFPRWSEIASRQHLSTVTVHGARGTIYDTQGRVLAASVKSLAIAAHPKRIHDPAKLARELGPLLPLGEKEILTRLTSGKKFVWLSRGVPLAAEPTVRDFLTEGVSAAEEFARIYPQGSIAGPLLGKVGRDGAGLSGIEQQFQYLLAAPDRNVQVRRDARGKLMHGVSLVEDAEASQALDAGLKENRSVREEGGAVTLSIDTLIQGIVEEEIRQGAKEAKAQRAFAVVLDAETGEILALAQSGEYDPNSGEALSPEQLRNAVLQDSFEPGSTVKPLVAAVAVDRKAVRLDERMNCESGKYAIGRHVVRDVHPVGEVPFSEVLVRSSNICMAKIGQRLGKPVLEDALQRYGFGATTGVELPGEAKGILRPLERWADIDVATHAFGQGVSVTSLQLVQAYSALANDGFMVQPTILKRDRRDPIPRAQLFSAETARNIAEVLRGVTESEHGTGLKAAVPGVHVSGKTGTAQKARARGHGYDPNKIFASFIGFLDGKEVQVERKLVMFVAVDEPGVYPRWGGTVAGPIFRRSMERILSYLRTLPVT